MEEFQRAIDLLIPCAEEQGGFLGVLPMHSKERRASETTLVALWETLAAMRASKRAAPITQAVARLLSCCEGVPRTEEREVSGPAFPPAKKTSAYAGRVI
jgi:heme-degrading monooxygenase HmoA